MTEPRRNKKYYKVSEVAEMLGFDQQTIRKWCRTEKIESIKINTHYRISAEQVSRLVNQKFGG